MPDKIRRYHLKTREAKALLSEASEKLRTNLEQILNAKPTLEIVQTNSTTIYLIKNKPILAKTNKNIFPTLLFEQLIASAPKIIVDMGAVPHICNGADIMAPGIVRFEGKFEKDSYVYVIDEKHGKPIAVGRATCNLEEAKQKKQGVLVANVHFVGDNTWKLIKSL